MNTLKRVVSPLKNTVSEVKKQKISEQNINSNNQLEKSPTKAALEQNYDFLFDESADFDFEAIESAESNHKQQQTIKFDLLTWQRCVVDSLNRDRRTFDLVLQVHADQDNDENVASGGISMAKCHLQGPWSHTRLNINDVVSIKAVWNNQLDAYCVNKDDGFCVLYPDTLISGTTVVGSLFCRRKAVLQERFRGIDANNKVMVIGSLVHELLQTVLNKNVRTYKGVESAANELLCSQETAYMLYSSLLTREDTQLEVEKFVPNIVSFLQQYVEGNEPAVIQKDLFQGKITQIEDIEENLWVPQLGLKGKIDVSVRVNRKTQNKLKFEALNAIPLELKTGRASFSLEHKGQVTLYQMMLSTIGRETNSGLLLYLREGIMKEIQSTRNEQRDLIILRNDLAHYLAQQPIEEENAQCLDLPDPISHPTACNTCAYASICCTFAQSDPNLKLRDSHPLRKLMLDILKHMLPEDYEYFFKWCSLLLLEEKETRKTNFARSLWTDSPEVRQANGRAVVGLQLLDNVTFDEIKYLHTFSIEKENEEVDFTLSGLSVGEYVIVSSRKRIAIAAGFINELTKTTLSVSLERNLQKKYAGETFIIDKHESQTINTFNFTNLGLLLDDNEQAAKLRAIVMRLKQPTFGQVLPKSIATKASEIIKDLNSVQRTAVKKALTTNSFMLIKGLPGTGKTQTLVAIVRLLHLMGKTMIITSHTHSAVDNLLLRLKAYSLPMLRLGSGARINPQLQDISETVLMKDCQTEAELSAKYASYSIVGVTCLGSSHSIFLHRKFDVCIVDEATQVLQPTVLRPLFFSDKFILVGDPDQLPPLVRSREARQRGADESLFHRLDTEQATSVLTIQYRMNKTITKISNDLTYGGALQCAADDVKMASLKIPIPSGIVNEKWLQRVLQTHIDQSVFLLDTKNCAERSYAFANTKHSKICAVIEQAFGEDSKDSNKVAESPTKRIYRVSKYTNYCEAAIILNILRALLEAGYDPDRIGVIAPYRAQVELLKKLTAQYDSYRATKSVALLHFCKVEVNTVDQYQGRDKDIIIYSCTKSGTSNDKDMERDRESEILQDKRRLTVAITRSKHKLIIVGDSACLQQYTPFKALITSIPSFCKLSLEDNKLGFDWNALLDQLNEVIHQ